VRAVGKPEQKKINPSLDYNNFPFPDFNKKQEKLLEEAGGRIHRARGSLKGSTLSEAYIQPHLPDHLVMAHEELDRVVKGIFGLPETASEEDIAQKLFENYMVLFQKS
jgi:protein-tyrosine phosphatase